MGSITGNIVVNSDPYVAVGHFHRFSVGARILVQGANINGIYIVTGDGAWIPLDYECKPSEDGKHKVEISHPDVSGLILRA